MKFCRGCIVKHPTYGTGIVVQSVISASGVNELYTVVFCNAFLENNGVIRVRGSDLTLVGVFRTPEDKEEPK